MQGVSKLEPPLHSRADPFWAVLEYQLDWVLDFCLWPKKWEIQSFFEIVPHLHSAPRAFLIFTPKYINIDRNRPINARYAMLVFIFNVFREKDIYDLESCIRITFNFF